MPNARKQVIGRRSKASGELFETYINRACEYYLDRDIAIIEKTPEPFHMTRRLQDGKVQGYYEKKGQPDYKGLLCDGTGIMFEAKHTDKDRILQSILTQKQWEQLEIYSGYGAHCFVMVSIGLQKFYRVPWDVWKRMKELFGHKYMNEKELQPYQIKEKSLIILILEGIEIKENTMGCNTEDPLGV